MKPKTIYVSYDGVLEPLGYSQIICYLKTLSENHDIILLSYEKKKDINIENINHLKNELKNFNIKWYFLKYHRFPRLISTIYDIINGLILLCLLIYKNKIVLLHTRSYIASLIAIIVSFFYKFKFKFIFDMRGFWIDEKSDRSGLNKKSFTYNFFKKVEKLTMLKADTIVTLTQQSKNIIINNFPEIENSKIYVIPTCGDEEFFKPVKHSKIISTEMVFGYIGSIDTAYNIEKIILSFSKIILQFSNAKLKILTNHINTKLEDLMQKYNVPPEKYLIESVSRDKIANEINTINFGIFYLNKNYSSLASFPTKIAEYLLCGKPIICNDFNNDITKIINENNLGIINEFNTNDHNKLIDFVKNNYYNEKISIKCREYAINNLSLQYGNSQYKKIYNKLLI